MNRSKSHCRFFFCQIVASRGRNFRGRIGSAPASFQVAPTQWSVVPLSRLSTAAKTASNTTTTSVARSAATVASESFTLIVAHERSNLCVGLDTVSWCCPADRVGCVSTTIRLRTVGASSTMPDISDDDAAVINNTVDCVAGVRGEWDLHVVARNTWTLQRSASTGSSRRSTPRATTGFTV